MRVLHHAQAASDALVKTSIDKYSNAATELHLLSDGSGESKFRAVAPSGKQFLIPSPLADMLLAAIDESTSDEILNKLTEEGYRGLTAEAVKEILDNQLLPRGLVRIGSEGETPRKAQTKRRKPWDFSIKCTLLNAARLQNIGSSLSWLFHPGIAAIVLLLSLVVHISFYSGHKHLVQMSPAELIVAYILAIVSVLIHEFGHSAACRRYNCEHGELGFALYLIFPALYVDLSKAWRLSTHQRMLIDVGGIYFQLICTIPLYAGVYILHQPFCGPVIVAIDAMTIMALNPLLKFDGYWLLVDCVGVPNLQSRSIDLLRSIAMWPWRQLPLRIPGLGAVRRSCVILYTILIAFGLVWASFYMLRTLPKEAMSFAGSLRLLYEGRQSVRSLSILQIGGSLLESLFFFIFTWRFLSGSLTRLAPQSFKRLSLSGERTQA